MLYNNLKKIVKKFPTLWGFFRWAKDSLINLSRAKDAYIMMALLHLCPKYTYKFSTRKLLPNHKNRYFKKTKSLIPYDLLESKSNKIPIMEEINVIGLGSSFDMNNLKNLKGPIFLITLYVPLKIDEKGSIIYTYEEDDLRFKNEDKKNNKNLKVLKNNNLTYVINRKPPLEQFKREGHNVLSVAVYVKGKDEKLHALDDYWASSSYLKLFDNDHCRHISLEEKIYRHPLVTPPDSIIEDLAPDTLVPSKEEIYRQAISTWAPSGSFLSALCALSYYAKKINVYGWDFYLGSSPKNMSYWQLLFNMYNYKLDTKRSRNHFESSLINFYYAYHFSKLPNFNINGYLGQLDGHEKLIEKIERVLFN